MVSESIVAMMKEYRKKRDWDHKAFADRLNVSKNTVWRYERGEATPTLETIEGFARMTGKTIAALLDDETEETEESQNKRQFLNDVWDVHLKHFCTDDR